MKRILFVDDESRILDGIRRMMRADRNRWDMQFAVGGDAALQACEQARFDVVISDMKMPGMDGATLLAKIRDRFPGTVRIILSGYSEVTLTTRAVPVAHRYLAKPCDATELRSTIERMCDLQEIIPSPEIRNFVTAIGELPSPSSSYEALTAAVRGPSVSVEGVTKIIEQDVAMSAKVLQLVNSAFFGLAKPLANVQSAVGYLGLETVKSLASESEAFRVFVPDPRIDAGVCEAIQQHAQRTAAIAAVLPVDSQIKEVLVLAALLHDIGRFVLASRMPDQFCSTQRWSAEHKCEPFEAEEELLGTSHAEIGAYLLGLWGIPNAAIEAIGHHHRPTRIPHTGLDVTVAVYVADLLAHEGSAVTDLRESDRKCLEELGILSELADFRRLARQARAATA
jgi:HD-like signal output (HDOD) protein